MLLHHPFGVFFIPDFAYQLFQNVFYRQNTQRIAQLITDNSQLHPVIAHFLQHLVYRCVGRDKGGRVHQGTKTGLFSLLEITAEKITDVHYAHNVVDGAAVKGNAGMAMLPDEYDDVVQ